MNELAEITEMTGAGTALAVNEFTMTEALFREGCGAVFSKKYQRIMVLFGLGIAAAGVICLALQAVLQTAVPGIPLILLGIGTVIWAALLPGMDKKRKWKAFRLKSHGRFEKRTVFTPDGIEVLRPDDTVKLIPYADVLKVMETEHLRVLVCANRKGIMLEKNSFTLGSFERIAALLP